MYLILILQDSLTWSLTDADPRPGFAIDSSHYLPCVDVEWLGFYDYLWDKDDRIVGISYFPDIEDRCVRDLIENVFHLPYIHVRNRRIIDVVAMPPANGDIRYGGEQEFFENRIYRSDNGVYAMSLGVGLLFDPSIAFSHWPNGHTTLSPI